LQAAGHFSDSHALSPLGKAVTLKYIETNRYRAVMNKQGCVGIITSMFNKPNNSGHLKETDMKRWMKRTLFAMFGAAVLIGSLGACSHHGNHGWSMSAEDQAKFKTKMVDRVSSKLDLNDEQKKRLGVVADKMQEQRAALMDKSTDPRADIQALVAGPKFDIEKAQSLIAGKTAAINTKSPEVLAAFGDFYDHLTPEQQTKVREFMAKRRGWGHRG
jgi:Spy/CpxP family protein refolding chaperone